MGWFAQISICVATRKRGSVSLSWLYKQQIISIKQLLRTKLVVAMDREGSIFSQTGTVKAPTMLVDIAQPRNNVNWYMQLGCSTLIYRYSTLLEYSLSQ